MNGPIEGLLRALDLTDTGARTDEDIFTGPSQWMPRGRVFGGQVLAQSLVAAMHTVPDDRPVHSMHGYFLRPGDVNEHITFAVDRIHDGRSFSTRRTQAYQSSQPILSMIASFQHSDEGVAHQVDMPDDIPDPESLPTTADVLAGLDHEIARHWATERPFDMRHVPSPIYLAVDGERAPHQAVWLRAIGTIGDDQNLHRAALAYASDYSILEPVLRRHGVPWATPGSRSRASTTRCGGTATCGSTTGCCTCRSRRARAVAGASPPAASTIAPGCSWRRSRRRAWCACPTRRAPEPGDHPRAYGIAGHSPSIAALPRARTAEWRPRPLIEEARWVTRHD
ncbi:hypothetical protein GCM10025877_00950 [Agromyces mangrovi Wang et al. 2018]|nr:hypothetical protein GCM10025877_00950 [Agromyces mangrovi]